MKIIFLDIDGVLNTDKWEAHMLSQRLPLEDEFGIFFDKEAINNLSFASNDFLRQRHKKTTWILA